MTSSRLKATPEHDVSPLLPYTICWTLTAVPQSSGSRLIRRYCTARSPIHESNTAWIACLSCSLRVGREVVVGLEALGQLAQRVGVELDVERHAALALDAGDLVLEALARDPAHDVAEHLHQAAVAVPGEPVIAGARRQTGGRLVVQPQVQDRVHHPRHRHARARAHRDEQRIVGVAKPLAGSLLERGRAPCDLLRRGRPARSGRRACTPRTPRW